MAEFAKIDQPAEPPKETARILPRDLGSGSERGTRTITNQDGSKMTVGRIPDTEEFGIAFYDSSGRLVSKETGETRFVYNPVTGKNVLQDKKLPDDSYGLATAKDGFNVEDAFSEVV